MTFIHCKLKITILNKIMSFEQDRERAVLEEKNIQLYIYIFLLHRLGRLIVKHE